MSETLRRSWLMAPMAAAGKTVRAGMDRAATRRRLTIALGLAAFTASFASSAQQHRKIARVGFLHPGSASPSPPIIFATQQSLRALGYVEGQNIAIEYRWGRGEPKIMPQLALELAKLKVDVLIAVGTSSISAATAAAGTIPIVATDLQVDPVASGLAVSLAKPGGNITGLFLDFPSLMGKWLELLREVVPGIKRVGVLWDTSTGASQLDALAVVAKALSIELEVAKFQQGTEIEAALGAMLKRRPQALIQLSSPLVNQGSGLVAKLMHASRLPAISMFASFPEAGGLMSFGPDLPVYWTRVGSLVDKILKGSKPGTIPIERPTTFEMIVNMKTAKAFGIAIPPTVLVRATRVIE